MALTRFTDDIEIIQKLSDLPNDDDGLSADELKEQFDLPVILLKAFLNETLLPEIEAIVAAAASGVPPIEGLSGLSIIDKSIPSSKLKTTEGQQAVTEETIRPGAVTYEKLGADVKTRLENILNAYASVSTRLANLVSSVTDVETLANGKQNQHATIELTLNSGSSTWTKTVPGLTPGASVFIAPAPSSLDLATKHKIVCTNQTDTTLTFTARSAPASNVKMNVAIFDVPSGGD